MNASQMLDQILNYNQQTINNLSAETGQGKQTFYDIRNGKVKSFSSEVAKKITDRYPFLSFVWLTTGKGEMLIKKGQPSIKTPTEDQEEKEITGYYYPDVNASAGLDLSMLNGEINKVPMFLPQFGKDITFINVYGDSMYPRYNSGEIIGVKLTEYEYLNYGYPYVVVFNNGDVYIKYIKKGKDEEHLLLESENPFYEPREFHKKLIKAFYSIRGVVKKEMM